MPNHKLAMLFKIVIVPKKQLKLKFIGRQEPSLDSAKKGPARREVELESIPKCRFFLLDELISETQPSRAGSLRTPICDDARYSS